MFPHSLILAQVPFNSKNLSTTMQGPSTNLSTESAMDRSSSPAKTSWSLSPQARSIPLKVPFLYVPPFRWKYHTPQVDCLARQDLVAERVVKLATFGYDS